MPSWKKVIISGSDAVLSALVAPSITGSLQGTASFAVTASYFNAAVVTTGSGTDFSLYSTSPAAGNSGTRLPLSGSITFGYQAGYNSSASKYVNLLGFRAGYSTNDVSYSNFLGHSAGSGADNADQSQFIGYRAGYLATGANNSVFIGYIAGQNQYSASYSTIIGSSAGRSGSWGALGNNNIIIGTNISLPNGYANYANIGGVLFISGTYSATSGDNSTGSQANGRIGIGIVNPSASLHIANTSNANSFLVEDATNPDNTPFLIDNAGNVMIGTTSSKGEVTIAASGADGLVLDTDTSSDTRSSRLFFKNSGSFTDFSIRNTDQLLVIAASASAGVSSGTGRLYISSSGEVSIGTGYDPSAGRGAILQLSGSVNIEDGFAYKQDGENVIYIQRNTGLTSGSFNNTIAGMDAAAGTAYFDQMTAFGYTALYESSGSDQTAFGYAAGSFNSGSSQTLIGWGAGYQGKASNQTAVGENAGSYNTGSSQTAVGVQAGYFNTGSNQTAIGLNAGWKNTATQQTAVGVQAGYLNIGIAQTALGQQAGQSNSGSTQTAVGYASGFQNSGSVQVAIGANAGRDNTGDLQTATGYEAGRLNIEDNQSAHGYRAGYGNSGSNQTAIGSLAGRLNSGSNQTAVGVSAGEQNTANTQTAIGSYAGYFNTGSAQTVVGYEAGYLNTGSNQTAVGYASGYQNSGSNNTNIGYQAGTYTTGVTINSQSAQSVFLGSQTTAGSGNRTNQIVIGYNAEGIGSNSVVLGNSAITTTALRGDVGIGTTTPTASLHVNNTTTSASFLVEDSTNPDTTPFIIDSTGNVGIGTTTPTAKLHVSGNAGAVNWVGTDHIYQQFYPSGLGAGRFGYIGYGFSGSTQLTITNEVAGGNLALGTVGNANRLFISASGNVGINTTSTTYTLQIHAAPTASIRLQETGSGGNKRLDLTIDGSATARISANQSAQSLAFDTSGGERLRITKDGDIGINTTTPLGKLTVSGSGGYLSYNDTDTAGNLLLLSGSSDELVRIDVSALSASAGTTLSYGIRGVNETSYATYGKVTDGFMYASNFVNGLNIINYGEGTKEDYIRFYAGKNADGTTPDLHIQGSGSNKGFIGINKINPNAQLDVNGNTIITGSLTVGNGTNTNLDPYGFVYGSGSYLKGSTANSAILGGTFNKIDTDGTRNVILGGTTNTITGSGVNGGHFDSAIIGGRLNTIHTGTEAQGELIAASDSSSITDSVFSAIIASRYSNIQGFEGYTRSTTIIASDYSSIDRPGVTDGSQKTVIIGGEFHTINGAAMSAIIGGRRNHLPINISNSVILGGSFISGSKDDTVYMPNAHVTGSFESPAGNTINSNALIQAGLLYLSNNF